MNHAVAVDHLTDWSASQWWLHYLGAVTVPMLAAGLVVAAALAFRAALRLDLPNLVELALAAVLTGCAFTAVFLGLYWQIELLYDTLRHTSTAARAVLAALVIVVIHSAVAVTYTATLGVTRRRWLAGVALACAVPAAFSLAGDGLNRSTVWGAHDAAAWPVRTAGYSPDTPPLWGAVSIQTLPRAPPPGHQSSRRADAHLHT